MALFGNEYDRDYGYGYRGRNNAYDRNFRSGAMWGDNRRGATGWGAYDRDFDRSGFGYERGYDRGYKSRWQTDYGDPFGDRTAHTPIRMIRGEFRGEYDRGFRGNRFGANRGFGYERDYYETNPAGYEPYRNRDYPARETGWGRGFDRGYDRNFRTRGRGYDAGWF